MTTRSARSCAASRTGSWRRFSMFNKTGTSADAAFMDERAVFYPAVIEDGIAWTLKPFQELAPGDLFKFGDSFAGPVWTYSGSGFYRRPLGPDTTATKEQIEGRV